MPTSSQSLILKASNGELPPLFQRTIWLPTSSIHHVPFTGYRNTRTGVVTGSRNLTNVFPLRRIGSDPMLTSKYDFSTLRNLLQIKQLGACSTYDNRVDFHKLNTRPRELAPIKQSKYIKTRWNEQTGQVRRERLFLPDFRRPNNKNISLLQENDRAKPLMFMAIKMDDDKMTLEVGNDEKGDYFRLIEQESNLTHLGARTNTVFKLEKASRKDSGSFRISPIHNESPGHFFVLPPDGYETDVYRLHAVSDNPLRFKLLQRDAYENELFRTVENDWSESKMVAFDKTNIRYDGLTLQYDDKNDSTFVQTHNTTELFAESNSCNLPGQLFSHSAQNLASHFGEDHPLSNQAIPDLSYCNWMQEDNNWYKYITRTALHNPDATASDISDKRRMMSTNGHVLNDQNNRDNQMILTADHVMNQKRNKEKMMNASGDYEIASRINNEEPSLPVNSHMTRLEKTKEAQSIPTDEQDHMVNQRRENDLMGSIRNQSMDMYERLVNLGFRRTNEDPEKFQFYENIRNRVERVEKERQRYYSSDWRTQNFDRRGRSTQDLNVNAGGYSSLDSAEMILRQIFQDQASSLGELSPTTNDLAWKKRKFKVLRMRKDTPPKDPYAICISLKDNAISHRELKKKIEDEAGVKLTSLQFDPVSVHCTDPDVRSQWIVRFPNKMICEYLTKCGITIDGAHYSVKSFDEVMQKEHNAFRFFTALSNTKAQKQGGQKVKRTKQTNSSEAQTVTFPRPKQVTVL